VCLKISACFIDMCAVIINYYRFSVLRLSLVTKTASSIAVFAVVFCHVRRVYLEVIENKIDS